jgi:hypothetical protein
MQILLTLLALPFLCAAQCWALSGPFPKPASGSIFADDSPLRMHLETHLTQLYAAQKLGLIEGKKVKVEGLLSRTDPGGKSISTPVEVHLKGFSTLSNCRFPKMELKFKSASADPLFAGHKSIDLNTHCAEPNDSSVIDLFKVSYNNHRETLMYRMMDVLQMPSSRTRALWISYHDLDSPSQGLVDEHRDYQAFFIEDMKDLGRRLSLQEIKSTEDPLETNDPVKKKIYAYKELSSSPQMDPEDVARIALFQRMIGNTDWFIKLTPQGECCMDVAMGNLWNVRVVEDSSHHWIPLAQDFSVSGPIRGELETSFSKETFQVVDVSTRARLKQIFRSHQVELLQLLSELKEDPQGQSLLRLQLEDFFRNIDSL